MKRIKFEIIQMCGNILFRVFLVYDFDCHTLARVDSLAQGHHRLKPRFGISSRIINPSEEIREQREKKIIHQMTNDGPFIWEYRSVFFFSSLLLTREGAKRDGTTRYNDREKSPCCQVVRGGSRLRRRAHEGQKINKTISALL